MSEQPVLHLETRAQTGSNATKKYRREGKAPGILFGHGESTPVLTDAHTFRQTVPVSQYGSQIVRVTLDGHDAGMALVKGIQLNTVSRQILNIDLQRVSAREQLNVSVSVLVDGEPADARAGAVVEQMVHSITLRCAANVVPEQITVDISNLHIGDTVHAAQLSLPEGVELHGKEEEVIVVIAAPTKPVLEGSVEVEATDTSAEAVGPATGE